MKRINEDGECFQIKPETYVLIKASDVRRAHSHHHLLGLDEDHLFQLLDEHFQRELEQH